MYIQCVYEFDIHGNCCEFFQAIFGKNLIVISISINIS